MMKCIRSGIVGILVTFYIYWMVYLHSYEPTRRNKVDVITTGQQKSAPILHHVKSQYPRGKSPVGSRVVKLSEVKVASNARSNVVKTIFNKVTNDEQLVESKHSQNKDTTENPKVILYWTSFFSVSDFYQSTGDRPFKGCSKTCFATTNKSLFDKADALLIHPYEFEYEKSKLIGQKSHLLHYPHGDLPKYHPPHQRWVMYTEEPPTIMNPKNTKQFNDVFNWTITYRSDSDILNPYGQLAKKKMDFNLTKNFARGKDKLIAWFVSDCKTQSKREVIVRELQKHIPVDIFGACGSLKCPRKSEANCSRMLESRYKFYLSFENSLCVEYVTEKLWKVLKLDIIPIVLGGANYTKILPKKSFINILDFTSLDTFVNYLNLLDGNDTLYNEYFMWKKDYDFLHTYELRRSYMCSLCKKLHEDHTVKTYPNMDMWWNEKRDCVSPEIYLQNWF
ncbi:unnamed protein product [Owenia fusiformis]|uniref:Fucosyltransferase n=1 Tax=Owenia fusiformis TaxID=6347 RepID=A0A8S4Q998_OWEFU|nr:unnamed protein product [Owenia fusiformis]